MNLDYNLLQEFDNLDFDPLIAHDNLGLYLLVDDTYPCPVGAIK